MLIEPSYNVGSLTSFAIDAYAKYMRVDTLEDIKQLPTVLAQKHYSIMGGGSNTVFVKDFDGIIVHNMFCGKEIIAMEDTMVHIRCNSGETRDDFVKWTVFEKKRYGLENLIAIPGQVGASPVQNIGAYGVEAQDSIIAVHGIDLQTGLFHTYTKESCNFGYRTSIFKSTRKNTFFITAVDFALHTHDSGYKANDSYAGVAQHAQDIVSKDSTLTYPQAVCKAIASIRATKLPDRRSLGTAGSFFENPITDQKNLDNMLSIDPHLQFHTINDGTYKISAGYLIDTCIGKNFLEKNKRIGTYKNHALVLVHYGKGTGSQLVSLVDHIIQTVYDTYKITLVPEVRMI